MERVASSTCKVEANDLALQNAVLSGANDGRAGHVARMKELREQRLLLDQEEQRVLNELYPELG